MPGEGLIFRPVPKLLQSLVSTLLEGEKSENITSDLLSRQHQLSQYPWFYEAIANEMFNNDYDPAYELYEKEIFLLKVQIKTGRNTMPVVPALILGDADYETPTLWGIITLDDLIKEEIFNDEQAAVLSGLVAGDEFYFPAWKHEIVTE
jgi:hypothetical protein